MGTWGSNKEWIRTSIVEKGSLVGQTASSIAVVTNWRGLATAVRRTSLAQTTAQWLPDTREPSMNLLSAWQVITSSQCESVGTASSFESPNFTAVATAKSINPSCLFAPFFGNAYNLSGVVGYRYYLNVQWQRERAGFTTWEAYCQYLRNVLLRELQEHAGSAESQRAYPRASLPYLRSADHRFQQSRWWGVHALQQGAPCW